MAGKLNRKWMKLTLLKLNKKSHQCQVVTKESMVCLMKLEDVCVIWEKLSLDLAWIGQEDMVVINHLSVCSVDQWRPGKNGNLHLREHGMRPSGRMQFKEHAISQLGPGPRR